MGGNQIIMVTTPTATMTWHAVVDEVSQSHAGQGLLRSDDGLDDSPKGAVLSTLVHSEDVHLAAAAASGSVAIPVQDAAARESFAVGVVNNLAEGIVLTFLSVETDGSDVAHDLAVTQVSVPAKAKVVRLVEGWLLSPASRIDIAVDRGGTAAGGVVSFWVRRN